jgi:NAD(P)H-dependent flavin oxidoreductase YrpB (nitropropane dioxygenase family)
LGILSSPSFLSKDEFRKEIIKTKKLTKKPIAVNMVYLPMEREISNDDFLDVIIEQKIKAVETVGIVPSEVYRELKSARILCLHKVTSLKHAKNAEANGADAVCVEGMECAGHPGMDNVGSLVLIQRAVESLTIPVIAAGGFVDGRGLVAALTLGAEAILMGTRFMVTKEYPAHHKIKERCLQAEETDTLLALETLRDPVRYMKTELAEKC